MKLQRTHQFILLSIIAVSIPTAIYFFVADAVNVFGFSGNLFFAGELWRVVSYAFAHVSVVHLVENLIAMVVVSYLAYLAKMGLRQGFVVFWLSSMLVAFLGGLFDPFFLIAGASVGAYGLFGSLAVHEQEVLSRPFLLILLAVSLIIHLTYNMLSGTELTQVWFHAGGFAVGAITHKVQHIFFSSD